MEEYVWPTLIWSPAMFLAGLTGGDAWLRAASWTGALALVAGLSWAMICREWTAFALLATALASVHATYAVTSVLYFTRGWLGEPLMFALDGAAIVLPLVLAAYFTWRARRARVATSFVGIFALAYALPFFSFAYLFTYYVGM